MPPRQVEASAVARPLPQLQRGRAQHRCAHLRPLRAAVASSALLHRGRAAAARRPPGGARAACAASRLARRPVDAGAAPRLPRGGRGVSARGARGDRGARLRAPRGALARAERRYDAGAGRAARLRRRRPAGVGGAGGAGRIPWLRARARRQLLAAVGGADARAGRDGPAAPVGRRRRRPACHPRHAAAGAAWHALDRGEQRGGRVEQRGG